MSEDIRLRAINQIITDIKETTTRLLMAASIVKTSTGIFCMKFQMMKSWLLFY